MCLRLPRGTRSGRDGDGDETDRERACERECERPEPKSSRAVQFLPSQLVVLVGGCPNCIPRAMLANKLLGIRSGF
jgi:hypothetical protein